MKLIFSATKDPVGLQTTCYDANSYSHKIESPTVLRIRQMHCEEVKMEKDGWRESRKESHPVWEKPVGHTSPG